MFTELLTRFIKKTEVEYFSNWQDATIKCLDYDAEAVVKTFAKAATAVEHGEAIFEQDGRTYHRFSNNTHLIAALSHVSTKEGHFQVLDFGGALGSMYRQHRFFLARFNDFIWCVVDQECFVRTGSLLFSTKKLKFENTISDAVSRYKPNIAVMSSALQRLESPFDVLNEVAALDIPYLFIDRTPVNACNEDRITRGRLTFKNSSATFPAWQFSEAAFKAALQQKYRIINEFDADSKASNARQVGFFCEKIK